MKVTPDNISDIEQLVNKRVVARLRDTIPSITGLVVRCDYSNGYYLLHNNHIYRLGGIPYDMHGYNYGWWLCRDDFGSNDFEELTSIDVDEKLGTIL